MEGVAAQGLPGAAARPDDISLQVSPPRAGSARSEDQRDLPTRIRYGYRRVHVLLRRDGWMINQKKTRRIYRKLGLQMRTKTQKRRVKAALRADRTPPLYRPSEKLLKP